MTRTGPAPERISFRFGVEGTSAACLAGAEGVWAPEVWTLSATQDRARTLRMRAGADTSHQAVATSSMRALVARPDAEHHALLTAGPRGDRPLTTIASTGFRLLPAVGECLAVSWDLANRRTESTIWRIRSRPPWLHPVCTVPMPLSGGAPLDQRGDRVAFGGAHGTVIAVDMRTGTVEPLPGTAARSCRLLVAEPVRGVAVLAVDGPKGVQLGYLDTRGSHTGRLIVADGPGLPDDDASVYPLALAPGGRHAVLQVEHGARSRLLAHDIARDTVSELTVPDGVIGRLASWSTTGLRFPFYSPNCPGALARLSDPRDPAAHCRMTGHNASGPPSHLERLPGPAGPIEAVVLGDWRTARDVVVALHGGPEAAWRLDYHPLLHELALAGVAVVAPNQRGSTGYGHEHTAAIHHEWGGPDCADICRIGEHLRAGRAARAALPALYGESYGGYLALLAAGHQPDLWRRCAVVAPFLSGARLYEAASAPVRALIDRTGGRTTLPGGAGDIGSVADRLHAPVLILHGTDDPTVPVSQSRLLRHLLLAAGHATGTTYREIVGGGHAPHHEPGSEPVRRELVEFLTGPHPDVRGIPRSTHIPIPSKKREEPS